MGGLGLGLIGIGVFSERCLKDVLTQLCQVGYASSEALSSRYLELALGNPSVG